MKRSAMGHRKLKKLCVRLQVPVYAAVGLLECLWHLTAREAPRGDLGRLSDEDIALVLEWREEPERLIAALVECGWLDADPHHRLIVHDWHEHADDAIHLHLGRAGERFANGAAPSVRRLAKDEREKILRTYEQNGASVRTACAVVRTDAHEKRTASSHGLSHGHGLSQKPEDGRRDEEPARGTARPPAGEAHGPVDGEPAEMPGHWGHVALRFRNERADWFDAALGFCGKSQLEPLLDCLEWHLKRGREPTQAELQAAEARAREFLGRPSGAVSVGAFVTGLQQVLEARDGGGDGKRATGRPGGNRRALAGGGDAEREGQKQQYRDDQREFLNELQRRLGTPVPGADAGGAG